MCHPVTKPKPQNPNHNDNKPDDIGFGQNQRGIFNSYDKYDVRSTRSRNNSMFPNEGDETMKSHIIKNLTIICPNKTTGNFSVFMTNTIPDLEVIHHGQCFPMKVMKP